MSLDWTLDSDELRFSMPIGMEMVNDVIMKPYPIKSEADQNMLARSKNEAYVMLMDRDGEWRVSTF